jgi:hypothetical protein
MSQHAIENALQRRVEILKASLGSSTVEMLALTTSKEEQVEQFSKTMRALEAELLVMRGKGGKVDYLEQIIRGLQTEVTEERKGRMGAEQEVGHLQDNTRVLQEEHTRALQALQANTRADIVRLEQKVGASDAITRSKAEKVDQLEQNVLLKSSRRNHLQRSCLESCLGFQGALANPQRYVYATDAWAVGSLSLGKLEPHTLAR